MTLGQKVRSTFGLKYSRSSRYVLQVIAPLSFMELNILEDE